MDKDEQQRWDDAAELRDQTRKHIQDLEAQLTTTQKDLQKLQDIIWRFRKPDEFLWNCHKTVANLLKTEIQPISLYERMDTIHDTELDMDKALATVFL